MHIPISFFSKLTVCNGFGVFCFRGVGVLVGLQDCGYITVVLFCKPETGICISLLASQLAGAIVGVSHGRMLCAAWVSFSNTHLE